MSGIDIIIGGIPNNNKQINKYIDSPSSKEFQKIKQRINNL